MRNLAEPDSDFEAYLTFPDLIETYRVKVAEAEKAAKREFWQNVEYRRQKKRHGIELERTHRALLNAAVFPFTRGQDGASIGYQFIRASPLSELDKPNLDFLIVKLDASPPVAVFGESKGTIQDPGGAVAETIERIQVVQENLVYVKSRYLSLEESAPLRTEFVLVCPSTEVADVLRAVQISGSRFIVWHAPLIGQPILKLATPPEIPERHLMLHSDRGLNGLLDETPTARSCFDLWPKIHPALTLSATFKLVERDDRNLYVTEDLVRKVVGTEMFYLDDTERDKHVSMILERAASIGLLHLVPGELKYRVASAREKRSATESRAISLWIEHSLRLDLQEGILASHASVQDELRKLRTRRRTLEDSW